MEVGKTWTVGVLEDNASFALALLEREDGEGGEKAETDRFLE